MLKQKDLSRLRKKVYKLLDVLDNIEDAKFDAKRQKRKLPTITLTREQLDNMVAGLAQAIALRKGKHA